MDSSSEKMTYLTSTSARHLSSISDDLLGKSPQPDMKLQAVHEYLEKGNLAVRAMDFSNALDEYRKAIDLAESIASYEIIAQTYLYIGRLYCLMDDKFSAHEYYRKSYEVLENYPLTAYSTSLWNLRASIQFALTRRYHEEQEFSLALSGYENIVSIFHKCNNIIGEVDTLLQISELFLERKVLIKAEETVLKALELSKPYSIIQYAQSVRLYSNILVANDQVQQSITLIEEIIADLDAFFLLPIEHQRSEIRKFAHDHHCPSLRQSAEEIYLELLFNLATAYSLQHDHVSSMECFKKYHQNVARFHSKKPMESVGHYFQERIDSLENENEKLRHKSEETALLLEQSDTLTQHLMEVNQSLQIINQEKSEFLGAAAHDLKNPLVGMVITATAVKKLVGKISPDSLAEKMDLIITTSKQMTENIKKLLDVNSLEFGKITVFPEKLNLTVKLQNIIANYEDSIREKSLIIDSRLPEHFIYIVSDKRMLREIIDNLFSNAIKYSPKNKKIIISLHYSHAIQIENSLEDSVLSKESLGVREKAPTSVLLSFSDEGQGIKPEEMSRLFKKFSRLSTRPTAGESSTGLGLSIVKKLTDLLCGKVWCESTEGVGTTFYVELPLSIK